MGGRADPSGCGYCGVTERGHFQRWKPETGWHVWARPSDAQIKARMLKRREARAHAVLATG